MKSILKGCIARITGVAVMDVFVLRARHGGLRREKAQENPATTGLEHDHVVFPSTSRSTALRLFPLQL